MLRGSYQAKMDDKGRLKVPTPFRRFIEEQFGLGVYVTSMKGDCVKIYPLPEWEKMEQKIALLPSMSPARRKFLETTSYSGQQSELDAQGRVLISPLLRRAAGVTGDVSVMGSLTYLTVWKLETFEQRIVDDPYTDEDEAIIAALGI